ncbi:hypothetical protein T07_8667 [Trichinella nelsoni]|uniref:Uncharacterized protein n=1 Tax=Trichinella nelsoni TaxID=6336 RepID=A0A0V0S1A0_9BILA|nr:hypothetical protein T07_8667 [Trichinella nelsoni]
MNKLSDSSFSESVEQQFISTLSQSEYEGKWMRLIRKVKYNKRRASGEVQYTMNYSQLII